MRGPTSHTNTVARCLPLIAVIGACVVAPGCNQQYDPPSLINKLRVLGVRASPPQVRLGGTTLFDALVVGHDTSKKLCHSWAFCPLAIPLDGRFKCVDQDLFVPMGVGPVGELTSAQVQAAIQPEKLQKALDKLGFKLPAQLNTAGEDGKPPDIQQIAKQLAAFEFYVMFKIATADEHGGTCATDPTGVVDVQCKDRSRCLQGYKRVSLAMLPQYHHDNPVIEGVKLDDVLWPAAVTPSAVEYEEPPDWLDKVVESGVDSELFEGYGPTALKIKPLFSDKSMETIPESEDEDGNPAKEELLFSWFSEDGKYQKNRTWNEFPDNLLLLPTLDKGQSQRTISVWIVARDGRNGTDWVQRRITIDKAADKAAHPLCALEPTLKGCENVAPKG